MLEIPLLKDLIGKVTKPQTVHDSIDYLNYFVTAGLLAFFALLTSGLQYFGKPIQCWVPNEFSSAWEKYAEDFCFIQSTYYVPLGREIPSERNGHISYYRWVPVVLAIQAVCFTLPNLLWNILIRKTKFDPKLIVTETRKLRNITSIERKDGVEDVAELIVESLQNPVDRQDSSFHFDEWTIVLLYFFIKALHLGNVVMQLVLLNKFLGNDDLFWGIKLITNLSQGNDWQTSSLFPRVVLCDFEVREVGNIRQHTVQCVISMNLLNEKLYLVLWCWFLLTTVCTAINLLVFVSHFVVSSWRRRLVLDYLSMSERAEYSKMEMNRFADSYLAPNGVLLLTFISNHAGARVARDLVRQLFTDYAISYLAPWRNFQCHRGEHMTISGRTSCVSEVVARHAVPSSNVCVMHVTCFTSCNSAVPSLVASEPSSSSTNSPVPRLVASEPSSSSREVDVTNRSQIQGKMVVFRSNIPMIQGKMIVI